jgi:hypothetical protein
MIYKAKYIINDDQIPVIFSEVGPSHADVARALFSRSKIIGAGFCYIQDNRYVCYGESISLRVKSRDEEDSKILNRRLGCEDIDY